MYKVKFAMEGQYTAYGSFECKSFVCGEFKEQLTFWILQKDSTKNIQNQTIESSKIVAYQLKEKPLINGENVSLSIYDIAYHDYPLSSDDLPFSVHHLLTELA